MQEKNKFWGGFAKLVSLNVVLTLMAVLLVLPFTWMVLASLKVLDEIGYDSWLPEVCQWHNYRDVFTMKGIFFGRWYWNTVFTSCWITFLQVFTSSLAAFSFSRLRWKGRDQVFFLYLATMMLPGLVMMIPNYQNMILLGLVDSYTGLILPAAFSAFGTFLMRQFMMNIPKSLDEAAEIDGANRLQKIFYINLPVLVPTMLVLFILQCGSLLNVGYEKVYALQNATNLTGSEVISTYVYKVGMVQKDFAFSTATGLFNSAVNCVILVLANTLSKSLAHSSLW